MVESAKLLEADGSFELIKNFADKILVKITSENKLLIFSGYKITVGEIAAKILAADALRTKNDAKSSCDLDTYFSIHGEKIEDQDLSGR